MAKTVAQTSCVHPGSVRASERMPPPTVRAASYTRTERPARASVMAADRPFGPDPITTASSADTARLPIERRLLNPVEPAIDQQEVLSGEQVCFHPNPLAVEIAVED